jgi:DNA-binding transcriptional MerR regulator/methylmalonyl-CoA mutase cobalamin-binding subunit
MADAFHPIRIVARRTGLSPHVIRIWEKRYGAVKPHRSGTNRRLYSLENIERLTLLRDAVRAGHSVGQVATLPTAKLRSLVAEAGHARDGQARPAASTRADLSFLELCVESVRALDAHGLENALNRAATTFGAQGLLQRVIAPLAQKIGELWRDGTITAAHEHFASTVIRLFLGHATKPFAGTENAPHLIVATPTGQLHELGALLAAAAAANVGWRVTYLGASLPAAEIAGAARQQGARAVALSLVYPEDDAGLEGELGRLRKLLPLDIVVLTGGRAAPAYQPVLDSIGAVTVNDLDELCSTLDGLRVPIRKAKK